MISAWIRHLAVPLALLCAGTQVAPGSALLASAWTLGFHASDHAHAISVVEDAGHLDLVLSHEDRGRRDPEVAHHDSDPEMSASERSHVFHFTDADPGDATPRRTDLAPAAIAATTVASWTAPSPRWVGRLDTRARSSDLLRTVVLRI